MPTMERRRLPPQINHYRGPYTLDQILAIARVHPFYSDHHSSVPGYEDITEIIDNIPASSISLQTMPVLRKDRIRSVTDKLCQKKTKEANYFRSGAAIGITGGGSGKGDPMPFFTDVQETRALRAFMGQLLVRCNVLGDGDVAIVLNTTGNLYRSLSLVSESLEHAGVSTLMAGHSMDPDRLVRTCQQLQPNALVGAPSQMIQLARHVAEKGATIKFDRIIYTSEMLPDPQRVYLEKVFGDTQQPMFYGSIYGSAEAGPWAVANHTLSGHNSNYLDLIYDRRTMIVEIVAISPKSSRTIDDQEVVELAPRGTLGIILLTSLQKLRYPLVRYHTGDIGSLHDLPHEDRTSLGNDAAHLDILRFHGRNREESFKWQANFYDLASVHDAMATPNWGVFDWQIILGIKDDTGEHMLEIRLIREEQTTSILSLAELTSEISAHFNVYPKVGHLFEVQCVNLQEMVRSETAGKIIRLVDRTKN